MEEPILNFFKTFADLNRLRMAALLSEESLTIEELASRLGLHANEVPRHLGQIEKLGLLVTEGPRYRLDAKALEKLSREGLAGLRPTVDPHSNDENADDFDRKTVKNYSLPDGRLREIPMQDKKLQAILRHVVQVFEPGVRYTEKQVNEALGRYHEDFASLRRYLIERQMIYREANGSEYWRK